MLTNHNLSLTNEEIRRLVILSKGETESTTIHDFQNGTQIDTAINYMQLSRNLGLHRNSLNLINGMSERKSSLGMDTTKHMMKKFSLSHKKSPIVLKKLKEELPSNKKIIRSNL